MQKGFILAVVLWIIAALTLLAGVIMARINATIDQAYTLNKLATLKRDMMSTEQSLLFVISTHRWNAAGVDLAPTSPRRGGINPFSAVPDLSHDPTLRFDGTQYPGVGSAGFAIQDAGATLSLMSPQRGEWTGLMSQLGVDKATADQWLDQLNDYQDHDDLPGLNGMEAPGYENLGLPDPPNRFMVTPYELQNLPIARQNPGVTRQLIPLTTTGVGSHLNINTSPAPLLKQFLGGSGRELRQLVHDRSRELASSASQASSIYGLLVPDIMSTTVWRPSGYVRIELGDAQGRQRRWIAVEFRPNAKSRPWLIEYDHPVAVGHKIQEPDTQDAFSASFGNDATPPATSWPHYSAYFPHQSSPD